MGEIRENKISFHYQRYWARMLSLIPLMILLIEIHVSLEPLIQSNILFYLTGVPIIIIGIGLMLNLYDKGKVLIYSGTLTYENNTYTLDLKGKKKTFHTVNEIIGWTAGWYVFSRNYCLQLETDAGRIKLFSAPAEKGQDPAEADLTSLITFLVQNDPDLIKESGEEEGIFACRYIRKNNA